MIDAADLPVDAAIESAVETEAPVADLSIRDIARHAVADQKETQGVPADQSGRPEPARAPDGKFAPASTRPGIDKPAPDRTGTPPAAAAAIPAPAAAPKPPAAGEAPAADPAAIRPPPGWSPASKVAFDGLPESVKADIVKREAEVNQGFAKLAQYKPVDKYLEMAQRGGTTLDKALEQYTGLETLLRRDPFAGIEQVLRNVGINPPQFFQEYLKRTAQGGQRAPQAQQPARQQAPVDSNQIAAQVRDQLRAESEQQRLSTEVQRFAADPKNRFYENVKPAMAKLVQSGLATDILSAYDMACRLDPTIAPLINQAAPVNPGAVRAAGVATQARAAAKATTGAPSPGARPSAPALNPNLSVRDTALAALNAQKARA